MNGTTGGHCPPRQRSRSASVLAAAGAGSLCWRRPAAAAAAQLVSP